MSFDLPGLSMYFLSCLGYPRMHVQGEHVTELKTAIEHAYRKSIPQIIRNFSYVIKRKKSPIVKMSALRSSKRLSNLRKFAPESGKIY